jgi:hypothetical protein
MVHDQRRGSLVSRGRDDGVRLWLSPARGSPFLNSVTQPLANEARRTFSARAFGLVARSSSSPLNFPIISAVKYTFLLAFASWISNCLKQSTHTLVLVMQYLLPLRHLLEER